MTTFAEYLAKTGIPEAGLKNLTDKVDEHNALVGKSNGLVADINAARAQDPNNVDYLDARWRAKEDDPRIAETVAEFDAVAEQYEKLLKILRDAAKQHFVNPPLSEEETRTARKNVNDMAPTISEARKAIAAQLDMVESILKLTGTEMPEGGLISLLPHAESLKGVKGRKATTAAGGISGPYMTRVGDVLVNGVSTNRDGKGKFNYAADKLSEMWNAAQFPGNKVTAEELEDAYLSEFGYADRVASKDDNESKLTDKEFEFKKTIQIPSKQDDTVQTEEVSVKLFVKRPVKEVKTETPKVETPKTETEKPSEDNAENVEAKPETAKQSTPMKIDTRTENEKAAAKKAAAPQPKK